ncbi:HD domain-containing protein [bacterium]|nr:HD domain-containing protein [bacterium]
MEKDVMIKDIHEGDEFVGFYAIRRCELREYDNMFRLELELTDKTGSLPGVVWNDAREIREQLARHTVVKVKGRLGTYRDKPQARIEKIRPAEETEYDPDRFIPSTPGDIENLKSRVDALVRSIGEPRLKELADSVFGSAQFMKEFVRCPGGAKWHHPYIGGLIEHTVGVAELCDFIAGKHPELNRDLLVVAALLHDVGKIKEFSVTTIIEYSDEGRLEGHIVMGERFVRNMCERINGFPPRLKMLLSHLMLAHQGFKEFSSPVVPMIPEGFVLYYADEIDSKLNALGRIMENTQSEGNTWSEYVRLLGRSIFVGNSEDTE